MNKVNHRDDMPSEYTRERLGVGVRGKYYEAYQASHNVVQLIPEVAKVFPTDKAVNDALLLLIKTANLVVGQAGLAVNEATLKSP
jgi:hypothetical protein